MHQRDFLLGVVGSMIHSLPGILISEVFFYPVSFFSVTSDNIDNYQLIILFYFFTAFMVATQFFFTVCFLGIVVSFVLVLLFTLCCDPEQKNYVLLIQVIGYLLLLAGISGCIAVIIFACLGNGDGWMPGHENNFLGWSFIIGVIGSILTIIAAILFLVEADVQKKKLQYFKESQTRFQMDSPTA